MSFKRNINTSESCWWYILCKKKKQKIKYKFDFELIYVFGEKIYIYMICLMFDRDTIRF